MIIHNDVQLDFDDVLIAPQTTTINHRGDVEIVREYKHLGVCGIPIISANMTQTGTFAVASKLLENEFFATLHKFYKADQIIEFIKEQKEKDIIYGGIDGCGEYYGNEKNLFITVGKRNWEEEFKKVETVYKETGALVSVLLDVPNAYIPEIVDCVKQLREFMNKQNFHDFVKVGIGPSPVCDTRIKTGCGRPQLSAIIECANAAHQVGGYIIADGGFKTNADFCKALVAGADMCMSGSMFAGCEESNGEKIQKWYKTEEVDPDTLKNKITYKFFKEYYGMSSFRAQRENYGKVTSTGTSEGVECGSVTATRAILNAMNYVSCDVSTLGMGMCASGASVLLAGGAKGKRFALKDTEIMIHQPLGGARGQATDIQIQAKNIQDMKDWLVDFYSDVSGEKKSKIAQDIERDCYLKAEDAKKYGKKGLIDGIKVSREG
ncbi:unnamed protein product [Cylicocyclus nassatus]|uniref:Uncharacterized protein n=1 Tax=Cylicocyclus nassatus TaxID=53992 RepID=A0AA36MIX4_CYLNA|nr:unnamed protein product [Cylicocyclus nassatus]